MTEFGATFASAIPLVRQAEVDGQDPEAVRKLVKALGRGPFSIVLIFFSPMIDVASFSRQLKAEIPWGRVMGCSTAGELTSIGYDEGKIVAIAFPVEYFAVETLLVTDLKMCVPTELMGGLIRARQILSRRYPQFAYEFAMLLVDGLSEREDELTAALASGLGPVPLFGGSAADGARFEKTLILNGRDIIENAAILTFFRTKCPVKVFSYDHFQATEKRMVVTLAEPNARLVKEINGEPASVEYARLIGCRAEDLNDSVFAENPVVVRVGDKHHVRAIQAVAEDGSMHFFAAIDEGLVLTLAESQDIVSHLNGALEGLAETTAPEMVLVCDCIFRRVEAEHRQRKGEVSKLLTNYNVRGFSSYGEQIGSIHVNQTFTGVAIYPPGSDFENEGSPTDLVPLT